MEWRKVVWRVSHLTESIIPNCRLEELEFDHGELLSKYKVLLADSINFDKNGQCQICFEEEPLTVLGCSHAFCADCWQNHLKSRVCFECGALIGMFRLATKTSWSAACSRTVVLCWVKELFVCWLKTIHCSTNIESWLQRTSFKLVNNSTSFSCC